MDFFDLDFEQAKTRHILFKTKLRSILYGADIDEQPVLSEYDSPLGKWIYGHALKDYGHIPEMLELERVHATIHSTARGLVALYKNGQVEEAREGLATMELIAANLVALLTTVQTKIKSYLGKDERNTDEKLSTNYKELLELHALINDLDKRISQQTAKAVKTHEEAQESENKFRDTVKQAPVGIAILRGFELVVEMANETYLQLVDRAENEFVGKPLFDNLPEVKEIVEPLLHGVINSGIAYHGYELQVTINRFGHPEQVYFNFVYQPLREADNSISGVIVVATEVTQQVKIKQALQESERQFRNLVMQSPVAMTIFRGDDWIIEIANETLLKNIWRKEWADVQGKRLMDVFPELEGQQFPELLRQVMRTGITYKENEAVAYVVGEGGGKKFYLDFEYAPLFEADGTAGAVMVTVNDVTDKVEARNKIQEAEKRYRDLIEALPVALFTINNEGVVDLYNEAAAQLWGRHPNEGDRWFGAHAAYTLDGQLITPQESPMAKAFKENRSIVTEAYVQRPDGTRRHVISHPQPLHNIKGEATGALNVVIDITDIKEAEAALRDSEEKFRLLADFIPQLTWTGDAEGKLDYYSQTVYDFSGLTYEQIQQNGWWQIVHPDDIPENNRLWKESIKTGKDFYFEHRFRRHDGEYRWQLSRAVPQRDAAGSIQMWVGTSTDIHDRKIMTDELETKVQERTKQLNMANEDLVRSNSELSQFAYVASHDLQEPLRKIQAFISRIIEMEGEVLSVKGRDYFGRIQKSAQRMQDLILDLLSFSRANAAQKHFEEADLNVILQSVKDQLKENIKAKHAAIHSTELPVLHAIVFQFEQLFTNLLSNSLKFSKPGVPPVITIQHSIINGCVITQAGIDPTQYYHLITFADNGIGFDPQFNERVFQVFQRLHNKETYEGTGIGLAICKKIVENHKGIITANGEPDKGVVFNIYVPA